MITARSLAPSSGQGALLRALGDLLLAVVAPLEGLGRRPTPEGAKSEPKLEAEPTPPPRSAQQPAATGSPDATAGPGAEESSGPRSSLAVDIDLSSDSQFFAGLSGDVAEGGVLVSTYLPIALGAAVDLELTLPGVAHPLLARGRVRWLREHSPEHPRGVGVVLERLPEEAAQAVRAFCRSRPPLYYDV